MKRPHSNTYYAAIAACVALAIGSIGPWVSVLGLTESGLDNDGVLTLPAAIGALAGLIHHDRKGTRGGLIAVVILGALAAAIGIIDLLDVSGEESSELLGDIDVASAEWGLYLTCLSAIALAGTGVALLLRHRAESRDGAPPAPTA
jgi:hypothetical protein